LIISDVATNGFPAYDCKLGENVLIMSVVLAFLANSPMHAEVTSTPMPAVSNNPCRMCHLSVENRGDKQTTSYVHDFFGQPCGSDKLSPYGFKTINYSWLICLLLLG
jgi:hypothetical protein